MPTAVGIDLGTTYSCVAVLLNGKVEIIANEFGHRTTPSVVAFLDSEEHELVGDTALSQAARAPASTVYDAKRLLGRCWEDEALQSDIPTWPFQVFRTERGKVKIRVQHRQQDKVLAPEEVSAMVLRKMKSTAEAFLGQPVTKAVITVPAYFTDRQKRATREACKLSGLEVLRLIPEPSAAALAYGFERRSLEAARPRTVLIYDLGGGTFDVTVATIEGCKVKVNGIGGDSHLGGQDFDQRILNHVAQEVQTRTGRDLLADPRKSCRLLLMCERAKRHVTALTRTELDLATLTGQDLGVTLSRAKFEDLNKDLLSRTIVTVRSVLDTAELSPEDIEEVILVGGSTRMPCVSRLLRSVFPPGTAVSCALNPDEVVAHGAALLAAHLAGESGGLLDDILVHDVTPISIGIAEEAGSIRVLIPRHTPIPVRQEEVFATVYDDAETLSLMVYQGERLVAGRNQFIGEYVVTGLPPKRAGLGVRTALVVDANGVLSVEARHPVTGRWERAVLDLLDCSALGVGPAASGGGGGAAGEEAVGDVEELARLKARFALIRHLHNTTLKAGYGGQMVKKAEQWLEEHQDATAEEFKQKQREVTYAQRYGKRKRRTPQRGRAKRSNTLPVLHIS